MDDWQARSAGGDVRHAIRARMRRAILGCVLALVGMPALAQYVPAKLRDGKTPDFRGVWQATGPAYRDIEGRPATKGAPASPSIVVDPADGRIPYTPAARAAAEANRRELAAKDPYEKCWMAGPIRATLLPKPFQILQTADNVALVYVDSHSVRLMYKEPRPHFDKVDWYMGDTRYHWEGDTLVTDVTTMMETLWLDAAGHALGKDPHVTERLRMTGPDTLSYEATVTNPAVLKQPFTIRTTLKRLTGPAAHYWEDECLDDADGVRHRILPTDPHNVLVNDYRRWAIVDGLKNGTIK